MKCNACYLYAFVLIDESKGGEKLKIGKWLKGIIVDHIKLSIKIGINNQI